MTVLEWTGEGGRLTTPGEDDLAEEVEPTVLIDEIAAALAPYTSTEGGRASA